MDVRIGPQRKLSIEELMLSNCGTGEDSLESLGHLVSQASRGVWRDDLGLPSRPCS